MECKFRYELQDKFELKKKHFESYQSFIDKTLIPVYIVLGVGKQPDDPYELFVVPLKDMPDNLIMPEKQLLYCRRDIADQPFRWYPATHLLR